MGAAGGALARGGTPRCLQQAGPQAHPHQTWHEHTTPGLGSGPGPHPPPPTAHSCDKNTQEAHSCVQGWEGRRAGAMGSWTGLCRPRLELQAEPPELRVEREEGATPVSSQGQGRAVHAVGLGAWATCAGEARPLRTSHRHPPTPPGPAALGTHSSRPQGPDTADPARGAPKGALQGDIPQPLFYGGVVQVCLPAEGPQGGRAAPTWPCPRMGVTIYTSHRPGSLPWSPTPSSWWSGSHPPPSSQRRCHSGVAPHPTRCPRTRGPCCPLHQGQAPP